MRIDLHEVSKGKRGQALPPTSLSFATGTALLALAETEQRPTVLGLIASGRMRPDAGSVGFDPGSGVANLRRRVALVDAPDVCDPAPNVPVAGVAAEELMFAGKPSTPLAVRRWLEEHEMRSLASVPIADVSPRERVRLLLELTALRDGVDGIVLVAPDRHGGDPEEWWELAEDFAARGFAVLVIAGEASAMVLDGRAARAETSAAAAEMRIIGPDEDDFEDEVLGSSDSPPAEAALGEEPVSDQKLADEASEIRTYPPISDDPAEILRDSGDSPKIADADVAPATDPEEEAR
ncbi:MAG: hypothetical protein KKH75_09625 [Actinobacteria bacterium]|nr:hypothetical protein [Actinomycetota bacterium]